MDYKALGTALTITLGMGFFITGLAYAEATSNYFMFFGLIGIALTFTAYKLLTV